MGRSGPRRSLHMYLIITWAASKLPQGSRIEKSIKSIVEDGNHLAIGRARKWVAAVLGRLPCNLTKSYGCCARLPVRPSEKPNYVALPSAGGPVSDRSPSRALACQACLACRCAQVKWMRTMHRTGSITARSLARQIFDPGATAGVTRGVVLQPHFGFSGPCGSPEPALPTGLQGCWLARPVVSLGPHRPQGELRC